MRNRISELEVATYGRGESHAQNAMGNDSFSGPGQNDGGSFGGRAGGKTMMDDHGQETYEPGAGRPKRRICGIQWSRRGIYGLTAVVLFLVIAAAVGGGVGGSFAARNKNTAVSGSDTSIATARSTVSSTTTMSETSSTLAQSTPQFIGPSTNPISSAPSTTSPTSTSQSIATSTGIDVNGRTFFRDCPSSNNTLYSIEQTNSKPILWRKLCGFELQGHFNDPTKAQVGVNSPAESLDDCINLCLAANIPNRTNIASGAILSCDSVCWRNGSPGDDFPHQCFAGHTANSSTGFDGRWHDICDSAYWINEEQVSQT